MNKLLVIIVTFNAEQWLDRCFVSLRESTVKPDIMVIDNGSTDGTLKWIWEHTSDNVRIYPTGTNLGFGAANNIGLRRALDEGYQYVYLLNQDAWVAPDCFEKLIKAFESTSVSDRPFGILSPMQMQSDWKTRDRRFQKHCGGKIDKSGFPVVEVPFVMAAHWMLTRQCIEAVGGFSPAFPHYGEDENFIDRMHWHQMRSGVVRAALAVHDRGERKSSKPARMKLKYVGCTVAVSDPGKPFILTAAWQPIKIVGMSVKNFSWQMLRYLPQYFRDLKVLKEYRSKSCSTGAFL